MRLRWTVLLCALSVVALAAQSQRPWMQGAVEKFCHQTQAEVDKLRKEFPGKEILLCACKHTCDPLNEHAGETDRRGWDAACEARCNPDNCNCKHPCDS